MRTAQGHVFPRNIKKVKEKATATPRALIATDTERASTTTTKE